jgi:hypothetical protein
MPQLAFAFLLDPDLPAEPALILAKSIRDFGGSFAKAQVWAMVFRSANNLPGRVKNELGRLDVRLESFTIEDEMATFPFALKVAAAAAAEEQSANGLDILVWMDTDSIVIQAPNPLILAPNKDLGYRPVDHTLIGSRFEQPLDPFWEIIYQECQVPPTRIFPMITSVDQQTLRPYFNAGLLAIRPSTGIMRQWRHDFQQLFSRTELISFYTQNPYYRFFFHQAVLAGTILATLPPERLQKYPPLVNYPLHMHNDYPAEVRPTTMNQLITCRYDVAFQNKEWDQNLKIEEPLRSWLVGQGLPVEPT